MTHQDDLENRDLNRDPITGAPGAHPIGTGIGAAIGAIAGATAGAIAGPVGFAIGGVVAAIAGGILGRDAGEEHNPTAEMSGSREAWRDQPY